MLTLAGPAPEEVLADLPSLLTSDLDLSNWHAALESLDHSDDAEIRGTAQIIRGHLLMAEGYLERLSARSLR